MSPALAVFYWLRVCVSFGAYFALAPFGYALFFVLGQLPWRGRERFLRGSVRAGFIVLHHWLSLLGFLRFRPGDVDGSLPPGPCVLIANHPSLVDVTAIMAAFPGLTTPVKRPLYELWWLRPLLRGADFPEADPQRPDLLVTQCLARLRRGEKVLVFPESTRTPRGGAVTFHRTPFELACRARVPVVPLVLRYHPVVLGKGQRLYDIPAGAYLRLSVEPPFFPGDFGQGGRRMRKSVEQWYRAVLDAPESLATDSSHVAAAG
jgi:1-acyl-sn-glycerol-3-phosphate acyltransferase